MFFLETYAGGRFRTLSWIARRICSIRSTCLRPKTSCSAFAFAAQSNCRRKCAFRGRSQAHNFRVFCARVAAVASLTLTGCASQSPLRATALYRWRCKDASALCPIEMFAEATRGCQLIQGFCKFNAKFWRSSFTTYRQQLNSRGHRRILFEKSTSNDDIKFKTRKGVLFRKLMLYYSFIIKIVHKGRLLAVISISEL